MQDLLSFRRMITPVFIQIIFWIGVAVCVIVGILIIISGVTARFGGGAEIFSGLLMLLLGPVFIRVYCEILILFFRMNETLSEIKAALEGKAANNQ